MGETPADWKIANHTDLQGQSPSLRCLVRFWIRVILEAICKQMKDKNVI